MSEQKFIEMSKRFFIDADYKTVFSKLGLTSIDAVFSYSAGKNLAKNNLARFRSRYQFEINSPASPLPTTVFLKRYDKPPILAQLRNWLCHRKRASMAFLEFEPTKKLAEAGISTPKTISYGEQWSILFEKGSFIITEKIPDAEALERKVPNYFSGPATAEKLRLRRAFVAQLAAFIRKFHETNYRHRDLYFSHIFYSGEFYLIDLARAFRPTLSLRRFQIKDLAQLYYSAQKRYFSNADRLRFYFNLTGQSKLSRKDKLFIRRVINKAKRMARHDIKHGRPVPFAS